MEEKLKEDVMKLLYVPESYVLKRKKGKGISLRGVERFTYS